MVYPRAVIFDLGGTLLDWKESRYQRWALSYDYLTATLSKRYWPERDTYINAMHEAELAHWQRVENNCWSGSHVDLFYQGFRYLGLRYRKEELLLAIRSYAQAVAGAAIVFPDTLETLRILKRRGYKLGLLSNTWWAAEWHDADLVAHGIANLLDEIAYSSELTYSKPHPSVFLQIANRLGIDPSSCVMVGDRMLDDVFGALRAGMQAVWKQNNNPWPKVEYIQPSATVSCLAELPVLLRKWGGT